MRTGDIDFEGLISGNTGARVMDRLLPVENRQGQAVR
jgi:hypothetical protein